MKKGFKISLIVILSFILYFIFFNPFVSGMVIYKKHDFSIISSLRFSEEQYNLIWFIETNKKTDKVDLYIPFLSFIKGYVYILRHDNIKTFTNSYISRISDNLIWESGSYKNSLTIKRNLDEIRLASWLSISVSRNDLINYYLENIRIESNTGINEISRYFFEKTPNELSDLELTMITLTSLKPEYYSHVYPDKLEPDAKFILSNFIE